jgi:secreted trypsin-like serine protease
MLCFVSIATCGHSTDASSRVVAGTDASLGEWPWQAWIHIKETGFTCGGSLIAPRWILTAAHCILENEPDMYHVILGDVNRNKTESSEQVFGVDQIIVHSDYEKPVAINNDVALLKLSRPARMNAFVNTVCLPKPYEIVPLNKKCYITGTYLPLQRGRHWKISDSSPLTNNEIFQNLFQ